MPFLGPDFHISELALIALLLSLALITMLLALRTIRRAFGNRRDYGRSPFAGDRVIVLGELVLGIAVALVVARSVAHAGPAWSNAIGLAVVLAAMGAFWFVVREYAAGLVLRATDTLRVGDSVKAATFEGHVKRMGRLWLVLETREATEARLPWSRVLASPVERCASKSRDAQHGFRVEIPDAVDSTAAIAVAREAILTHHGAHPARDPAIVLVSPQLLEINAATLLPGAAGSIESAVREALAQAAAKIERNPARSA
jgi:small-conductance mechanosensitive channel